MRASSLPTAKGAGTAGYLARSLSGNANDWRKIGPSGNSLGGREGLDVLDIGSNGFNNVNIVLPPLKGLRQIMDSPVTKDLLKELTASESAVLMQTYMMVENGAATGFMGSMNIGSNLMSNLLQTQDYQLKLLEASDDTGMMKKAYAARVAQEMQTGANKDVWPAALYIASGEDGKTNSDQMRDLAKGQQPYTLASLTTSGANTGNSVLFTELLFANDVGGSAGGSSSEAPYRNDQLQALKQEFRQLVGDFLLRMDVPAKYARNTIVQIIPPALDEDNRRGVAAVNWQEVKVVWESLHLILSDYCTWKQSNPNMGKEVFAKDFPELVASIGADRSGADPWELASAPDMTRTMHDIELLYKLAERDMTDSTMDCKALQLTAADIPDQQSPRGAANMANNCGPKMPCERNLVALESSRRIALSRTLHTYRNLFSIANRFATNAVKLELLSRLTAHTFANMNISDELSENKKERNILAEALGKEAQANTSSPGLKPGDNNGDFSAGIS